MNWSQIPPWAWALLPVFAFVIFLMRQRPAGWPMQVMPPGRTAMQPPAPEPLRYPRSHNVHSVGMGTANAAIDPHLLLNQEILRGLLRKEGILLEPPADGKSPPPSFLAVPHWYRIVPAEKEEGASS